MVRDHLSPPLDLTTCGVAAWASATAEQQEIAALRKNPGAFQGGRPPTLAVKLADDQAVLALVAVLRAIDAAGWSERSFQNWGIIAGPRYLARVSTANTLQRFERLGPRGVSPLAIPQSMLSAVSGTLSVALGAQGLNCGVGGAPGQLSDALLVGLTLLDTQVLEGLWIVLTEWSTEPVPDGQGGTQTKSACRAIALACTPHAAATSELVLTRDVDFDPQTASVDPTTELTALAQFLESHSSRPQVHHTSSRLPSAHDPYPSLDTPTQRPVWTLNLGGGLRAEVRGGGGQSLVTMEPLRRAA